MNSGQIAVAVLQALPALLQAGADIAGIVGQANAVITKGDPTQADWDALHAQIKALESTLRGPDGTA